MSPTPIPFADLSVVVLGDFLQLPSVRGKPIYALTDDHERIEGFLSLDLWKIFKFAELTEVMRQRRDIEFIEFLNKKRVENLDESVQNRLKARFVKENGVNYPRNGLDMFEENNPTLLHNKEILIGLPGVLHKIEAIDAIPGDFKYPKSMISSAQSRKQTDTGNLAKCLELKKWAKVMVTVNIVIQDRLINGKVGKVSGFEIVENNVKRVYIKFHDDEVGRKAMFLDRFCFQNGFVPIEKVDADIPIVKSTLYPTFKRTQFPLALSWACTIHKVQGLSLEQGVVSFDLKKQNSFGPGQMYTALSRVSNYDQLY